MEEWQIIIPGQTPSNSLPKMERLPVEERKEQPKEAVATNSISGN